MLEGEFSQAESFLQAAYEKLGYEEGDLYRTDLDYNDLSREEAVEYADWLQHASKAGADAVYFVENNPVVVFASCDGDPSELRNQFNSLWCLARPALLFLATPGALSVYSLSNPPVGSSEEWQNLDALDVVDRVTAVSSELLKYRAEEVDTGNLFRSSANLSAPNQRADQALIRDLEIVRESLTSMGMKAKYAHAVIGRSIFIRYLEDRGVLTEEYFRQIASENPEWKTLLNSSLEKPTVREKQKPFYPDILQSKEFTYSLFDRLSEDFNGDMFPSDPEEKRSVSPQHLEKLRDFLLGEAGSQGELFFWAYEFDIIPVDLISSIYEQFYHGSEQGASDTGAHYTPGALVEFTLSRVLDVEQLESSPRIIDPACGSGIFIVEAFRRIVRYRTHKAGRRLSARTLRAILRDQIAGIEVNPAAAQIAAFSLYLAFLDYQEPSDILNQIKEGERLPKLVYRPTEEIDKDNDNWSYNIIVNSDSFKEDVFNQNDEVKNKFQEDCADVVVGNPPWGDIPKEQGGRYPREVVTEWLEKRGLPIGYKEYAQAFVWRARELLREGGKAALLLPTGVFFKRQKQSRRFRRKWLQSTVLHEVVNFAHVRRVFFAKSISPFAAVAFENKKPDLENSKVRYWSAKRTAQIKDLQAVILSRTDLSVVSQLELLHDDDLWKIYWWGSHRDASLIKGLKTHPKLKEFCSLWGQGFKKANESKESDWLGDFPYYDVSRFKSYGPLENDDLDPDGVPDRVEHRGKNKELYQGLRILVRRGKSKGNRIDARLAKRDFCFRHSIQAIKLKGDPHPWKYKVLLGILWSSLAQYFLFLTSSNWGIWHEEVYLGELLQLPIPSNISKSKESDEILKIVDSLTKKKYLHKQEDNNTVKRKHGSDKTLDIFGENQDIIGRIERELDEAIFELYGLRRSDRDLIRDFRDTRLDLLYRGSEKTDATVPVKVRSHMSGVEDDVKRSDVGGLRGYLSVFLRLWNQRLKPDAELSWRVISPPTASNLAVVFQIISSEEMSDRGSLSSTKKETPHNEKTNTSSTDWKNVLDNVEETLDRPLGSHKLRVRDLLRVVSDREIIIIKRNERHLWTRSAAYEDVEATELQALSRA